LTKKNGKKNKYHSKFSKMQSTKKIQTKNLKNTKFKKKIRTQNFKNTKYQTNANSKMNQRAKPMFILKKQEPSCKINAKPTCCIF